MIKLLLVISLVLMFVTNYITYAVTKEKMRLKYRRKVKQERAERWKAYENGEEGLNAEEIAAKRINEALPIDSVPGCLKPYKLATLVVEHEDGYVTVEDHHLMNDDGEVFELSEFRLDDRNVDWMLDSFKVLESITANVMHEIVDNVARFSAFDETLNNCYAGRHGKDRIKVKDAFVVFTDLNRYQLDIIANHTDDDIFNKQFNSIESIKYTRNMRGHKKYRQELRFIHDRGMLEGVIDMLDNKINNIDNGILGHAMRTAEELAIPKLPVPTVIELPGDNMQSPELSQEEVAEIINGTPENKIFRIKDEVESILEKLSQAGYDTSGVTSIDSLITTSAFKLDGGNEICLTEN